MLSDFACTNGQVTASDGRILGLTAFARKDSIVNFHLVRPIFIFGILKQWLGRWFSLSKGLKLGVVSGIIIEVSWILGPMWTWVFGGNFFFGD